MLDLAFRSAQQLAAAIRKKAIGCEELLDLYLARVDRHNPRLNAIVVQDRNAARLRAREADEALVAGRPWGPLHGVPMTVKESYDVAGTPSTWGAPALKDNVAAVNALAIDRLLGAGAVIFGKTNVPLMLADWQSYNDVYGSTNNPWDLSRTPGGSSGGSAAALAAGLTGLEAGSDIGASIRNPAHYCGVFGHKPTYGIVPPRGQAPPGKVAQPDIAVIGPMARSADDLAVALSAMAGPDEIDAAGWRLALPAARHKKLADYKVAVMLSDPEAEVDREVQDRLQALADFLAGEGATVSDTARPDVDTREAHRVYIHLLRSATSGRQTDGELAKNVEIAGTLDPADDRYYARMIRGNTLRHRDWIALNEARHQMRRKWHAFFAEWDVLLCPPAPTAAFPHDHRGEVWERRVRVNGRDVPTTNNLFWAGVSGVVFLPATVAPIGFTPSGLPVGVQIVGAQYADYTTIGFARLLERDYQPFTPPPGYE